MDGRARRYAPSPDVLHQDIQGELVLIDLRNGEYFSLNEVGARVWQLLCGGPGSVASLQGALLMEFDVAPEQLAADLDRLLAELAAAGLIVAVPP